MDPNVITFSSQLHKGMMLSYILYCAHSRPDMMASIRTMWLHFETDSLIFSLFLSLAPSCRSFYTPHLASATPWILRRKITHVLTVAVIFSNIRKEKNVTGATSGWTSWKHAGPKVLPGEDGKAGSLLNCSSKVSNNDMERRAIGLFWEEARFDVLYGCKLRWHCVVNL